MTWQPEFDRVGLTLSIASLLILLYFGLTVTSFMQNLWVAFAFWIVGFGGSLGLGLARRSSGLTLKLLFETGLISGVIMTMFFFVNLGYSGLPSEIWLGEKLVSFAIGVSEELFFGVFLLSILIIWLKVPPPLAIIISAGSHAWYHVPNWGFNPALITLFFISFVAARTVYVYFFPKVGALLAAHGFWNLAVT